MIFRKQELEILDEKWAESRPHVFVISGQKNIGKTKLIEEFSKGKSTIYFHAERTTEKEQLRLFSKASGEPAGSWLDAFKALSSRKDKTILVLDNYPAIAHASPDIIGILEDLLPKIPFNNPIFIALIGEQPEVMNDTAKTFGIKATNLKLAPLLFSDVSQLLGSDSFEEKLQYYSVFGGIPSRWKQISPDKKFLSNISDIVLTKGQALYDQAESGLRQELRETRVYFAILNAIASKHTMVKEISVESGFPVTTVNKYLTILVKMGIVSREISITECNPEKSRKGHYRITDPYNLFWFRYIYPRRSELEFGNRESANAEIVKDLPSLLGETYKTVVREFLLGSGKDQFEVGRHIDKENGIDVVATNRDNNQVIFADVFWTEHKVGVEELNALKAKAIQLNTSTDMRMQRYTIFSNIGFTEELAREAKAENILLFKGLRENKE